MEHLAQVATRPPRKNAICAVHLELQREELSVMDVIKVASLFDMMIMETRLPVLVPFVKVRVIGSAPFATATVTDDLAR